MSEATNSGGFRRLFGNPFVGFVGSIASIAGIAVALYLYFGSQRFREFSYFVHPVRAEIVRAGLTTDLEVIYDGRPVTSAITATQIAFWNSGTESIRPGQVLRPIEVRLDPPGPILEAAIRQTSRDVVGLELDQSAIAAGVLGLRWRILEANDGGVVQLIHAGSTNTRILVTGVVEGQNGLKSHAFSGEIQSPEQQFDQYLTAARRYRRVGIILLALAAVLLVPVAKSYFDRRRTKLDLVSQRQYVDKLTASLPRDRARDLMNSFEQLRVLVNVEYPLMTPSKVVMLCASLVLLLAGFYMLSSAVTGHELPPMAF